MLRSSSSLNGLIQSRDAKRQNLQALFEQKRSIEEEMSQLQNELLALDDDIEAIEDQQQQQQDGNMATNTPLTMHPEEVLPEEPSSFFPTNTSMEASSSELLTDPLTCTQAMDFHTGMESSTSDFPQSPPSAPLHVHAASTTSTTSTASARVIPQLVLQPVQNKPKRQRSMESFVQSTFKTSSSTSGVVPSCPFSVPQITHCLQTTFSIPSFREHQLEIIQATLSGQDSFVIMRTGGGKSLTYQLPAALEQSFNNKVTLVISPLLSLIQDQQDQMNRFLPNSCVSFTSGMGTSEHAHNWQRVRDPQQNVAMILVTPEKVSKSNKLKSELQKLYDQDRLARFVIDECHCACQWGHDFRPDYAKLGVLKTHFPSIPVLAVTATASDRVRTDCCSILRLSSDYRFFRSSANRPNLTYQVRPKETAAHVLEDMVAFIQEHHPNSAGIIYAYSRKDADTVADQLCEGGIVAAAYHSDVATGKKNAIHRSWMRNETQVVVATIAFGLGINKPDVRFVLHHTLSKTLEAYYQESGRAGRDGLPADCVLYYSPRDVPRMIRMTHGESSEPLFWTMVRYAQQFGSDRICRAILLHNLGEPNQNLAQVLATAAEDTRTELKDVLTHAQTVLQLLFLKEDDNVTLSMLVKEWRARPSTAPECIKNNPPGKHLSVSDCERIIVSLLVNQLICVNVQWTSYDAVVYLRCTEKAQSFLLSDRAQMKIRLPKKISKAKSQSKVARKSIASADGWIDTKQAVSTKSTKRKRAPSKSASKKKAAPKRKAAKKKKATAAPKSSSKRRSTAASNQLGLVPIQATLPSAKAEAAEVIELDDSSSDEHELEIVSEPVRKTSLRQRPKAQPKYRADALMDDSSSEEEFD